jgi:hypothetical protein
MDVNGWYPEYLGHHHPRWLRGSHFRETQSNQQLSKVYLAWWAGVSILPFLGWWMIEIFATCYVLISIMWPSMYIIMIVVIIVLVIVAVIVLSRSSNNLVKIIQPLQDITWKAGMWESRKVRLPWRCRSVGTSFSPSGKPTKSELENHHF